MCKYVLIFIIIIISHCNLFGQDVIREFRRDSVRTILEYKFYNGYINDSTFSIERNCTVYLGKTGWVSDSEIEKIDNYLKGTTSSIESGNVDSSIIQQIRNDPMVNRSLHLVVLKKYNAPAYYKYAIGKQKDVLIADTALFNWNLTGEYKIIGSFKCQKAIIRQPSNTISAWFTESIPVSAGPSYIYGLPGLILEYINPEKHVCYRISKISSTGIVSNEFKKLRDARLVTKMEFDKLDAEDQKEDQKKIDRFNRMIKEGKTNNPM